MAVTGIPKQRVVVEHWPHAACGGVLLNRDPFVLQHGSGPWRRCLDCNDTGSAGIAFIRSVTIFFGDSLMDVDINSDEVFDRMLEAFITAIYGEAGSGYLTSVARQKSAHAFTVMQHSVNRAAGRSVLMLGKYDSFFNWLCSERRRVLAGEKAEFSW